MAYDQKNMQTNGKIKILGFDCANRSLAWSLITIDVNIRNKISTAIAAVTEILNNNINTYADIKLVLGNLRAIMADFVVFESCGVADILCGQKLAEVNEVERTRALYTFLTTKDFRPDIVLIEKQPGKIGSGVNSGAIAVSNQICYHYIGTCSVHFVSPKLKNALSFHMDIDYDYFYECAVRKTMELRGRKLNLEEIGRCKYTAAKKHSAENFLYFIKIFSLEATIVGIKAQRYPDLADSFMQIIAWLKSQNMI